MGKNRNKNGASEKKNTEFAKEFSHDVDRMLTGKKAETRGAMPDDYQEAIDFAQKLISLKGSPRPSFEAELKDSLLSKLSEMEQERAGRNRFWEGLKHLVPQQSVWRAAGATILVAVVAVGVIWGIAPQGKPPVPPPRPSPIPAPIPAPTPPSAPHEEPPLPQRVGPYGLFPFALELEIAPAKTIHTPEEEIKIAFKFKNMASQPIAVTPFPPTIGVTPLVVDDQKDWKEQVIRSFPAGSGELNLQPGETADYTLVWNQKDDDGQQVAPGYYRVNAQIDAQIAEAERRRQGGMLGRTEVLIQYPQGALEKAIEVNQSQIAGEITITLERVELSSEGARFYAFTTPPGFDLPQGHTLPPPKWMIHAWAQYTVNGITRDAGFCGTGFQDDGMRLSWGIGPGWLDPVPSDARELIFTITKFGDWKGPWEFHIPLR